MIGLKYLIFIIFVVYYINLLLCIYVIIFKKEDIIDRNLIVNWIIMIFEVLSFFIFKIFGFILYY